MPQRDGRQRRRARQGEGEALSVSAGAVGRPVWSGSLTFGLVTVPIELFSAQRSAGVPMRMLAADGTPLARQYVCPKEGVPLERDEIVRGYEVEKDRFVVVSDDELEAIAPRRSRDIELLRFVDRTAIDPTYFVRTYYLVPGAEQNKAYRLLAEIMEETGRAAIATFVMREHAYAVAIFADSGILRAQTLRFADELRTPEALGLRETGEPKASRVRAVEKAVSALEQRTLAQDELRDDEPERLLALARKKRERGEDVVEAPEAAPEADAEGGEVVDLMELLKARLGARAGTARRAPTKRRAARKRPTTRTRTRRRRAG